MANLHGHVQDKGPGPCLKEDRLSTSEPHSRRLLKVLTADPTGVPVTLGLRGLWALGLPRKEG